MPSAAAIYEAEDRAAREAGVRRFRRFTELEAFTQSVVLGDWWSLRFPDAPLEVVVQRRSRGATWSAASVTPDGVGLLWFVDGRGWGMETVLHELAHLAAGSGASHGSRFTGALGELWRHEAGIEAWAILRLALQEAGLEEAGLEEAGLAVPAED